MTLKPFSMPVYHLLLIAGVGLILYLIFLYGPNRGNLKKVSVSFIINNLKIKGEKMTVVFKPNQFLDGSIQPTDRKGNPAPIEPGTLKYFSDLEGVTITADPEDEKKFKIQSAADAVTAATLGQTSGTFDADLGDGVETVSFVIADVVLEPERATGAGVTLGEVQDVPAE